MSIKSKSPNSETVLQPKTLCETYWMSGSQGSYKKILSIHFRRSQTPVGPSRDLSNQSDPNISSGDLKPQDLRNNWEGLWLIHLGLSTWVSSTLDWTSNSDTFCSSLCSSSSSSSSSSLFVSLFCSFRVALRRWESWVIKSLLEEERESRWEGSRGNEAALQEEHLVSGGFGEEEQQRQLGEKTTAMEIVL